MATTAHPPHYPLESLYLCAGTVERDGEIIPCNNVTTSAVCCPSCAGGRLMPLGAILNRSTADTLAAPVDP
jgi:hypothetical protein